MHRLELDDVWLQLDEVKLARIDKDKLVALKVEIVRLDKNHRRIVGVVARLPAHVLVEDWKAREHCEWIGRLARHHVHTVVGH